MNHQKYMNRCLELAALGLGKASPNPMVGSVIVHNNQLIGEGYHMLDGTAHAEVNAVNSIPPGKRHLLTKSTMYVNMEPCSFYGRTPACKDLIIKEKIPHVVIANIDTDHRVAGLSVLELTKHGVKVDLSILHDKARWLNRRFFTAHLRKRPYIILKWAQSKDAYFAPLKAKQHWITGPAAKQLVHKWRAEEDAILVGVNTANIDNPQLNVRLWSGKSPHRFVIDLNNRLEQNLHLLTDNQKTTIYTRHAILQQQKPEIYHQIEANEPVLPQILRHIHSLQLHSLIVEGGAQTLNLFIGNNLWDEARVFTGPNHLFEGIPAPKLRSGYLHTQQQIAEDLLQISYNPNQSLRS